MDKGFVCDGRVSEPINYEKFTLHANMNGFGWDVNQGMFIPVEDGLSYFTDPMPIPEIGVIGNGGGRS